MTYQFIDTDYKYGVAEIIFTRKEKHNAFHAEMISEITNAISHFANIENTRALIIRSEGKSFSAGADLNYMKSMANFSLEENIADSEKLFTLFQTVYDFPVPVIVAVQGASFGGANGIIAAADYTIANIDAKFSFSEVRLGIIPATIAPFVVQKIGENNAIELFTSGRIFKTDVAHHIGLVNQVELLDNLDDAVVFYVNQLLKSAPKAIKDAKALARSFNNFDPTVHKERTAKLIAQARVSQEGQEGIQAFFEKRKPNWIQS